MSSLDHRRRTRVAARLAELARRRQVIIFTHDQTFVVDLRLAADEFGVGVAERSVERGRDETPGICRDEHPWSTKDTQQRLGDLRHDLAQIKKNKGDPAFTSEQYRKEVSHWAGNLSETWERGIKERVLGTVFDLSAMELRPKKFRVLARIGERDDEQFQASYHRISRWVARHDKSTELNYTPPDVADLEKELEFVCEWFARIRKYEQS